MDGSGRTAEEVERPQTNAFIAVVEAFDDEVSVGQDGLGRNLQNLRHGLQA
jgi:hypothetical protein